MSEAMIHINPKTPVKKLQQLIDDRENDEQFEDVVNKLFLKYGISTGTIMDPSLPKKAVSLMFELEKADIRYTIGRK